MQENMQKMTELMARIQQTTDPKERQGLLDQHLQAMRQQMQLMREQERGMGQGMMAGGMMTGQGGMGMMGRDEAGGSTAMTEEEGQDEEAVKAAGPRPGSAGRKGMMKGGMGMMGQGMGMMGEGMGMPAGAAGYPTVVIITGGAGMMGPGMSMMGSGGMMGPGMGMMGGDMMQMMHGMMHRNELLQQRVSSLEEMLQQLIEREAAEE